MSRCYRPSFSHYLHPSILVTTRPLLFFTSTPPSSASPCDWNPSVSRPSTLDKCISICKPQDHGAHVVKVSKVSTGLPGRKVGNEHRAKAFGSAYQKQGKTGRREAILDLAKFDFFRMPSRYAERGNDDRQTTMSKYKRKKFDDDECHALDRKLTGNYRTA